MPSYTYTGYARNTTLTISRGDDTPVQYSILDAIPGTDHTALTALEFSLLDEAQFRERLQAFIARVCSLHPGLADDCPDIEEGAVVYDPTHCTLGTVVEESLTPVS